MKAKSRLEILISARDKIADRMAFAEADVLYWQKEEKRLKKNTQEKVNAINNIADAKERVRKDKVYLACFDELIEKAE